MKKETESIRETHELAENFAKQNVLTSDLNTAVVVALAGDLGSGKTAFVQGFAGALGIKEKITSPTFVILKKFKISDSGFKTLIHVDAYRIDKPEEILDLGWEELMNNPENIILIEWAEKILKILPKPYFLVKFRHKGPEKRAIDISLVK